MSSEAALFVIVLSLSLSSHHSELGLQLAHLRVEGANRVRLEGQGLDVTGRITARLEIVDIATDPLREGVDVLRRRAPAAARPRYLDRRASSLSFFIKLRTCSRVGAISFSMRWRKVAASSWRCSPWAPMMSSKRCIIVPCATTI